MKLGGGGRAKEKLVAGEDALANHLDEIFKIPHVTLAEGGVILESVIITHERRRQAL